MYLGTHTNFFNEKTRGYQLTTDRSIKIIIKLC